MIDPRFLDDVSSLKDLTFGERMRLADQLVEVRYGPGDVIIREGQKAAGLYFLMEGEVIVASPTEDRPFSASTRIPAGEWFGMISSLDGLPATASICAVGEVAVACLDRQDFHKLVDSPDPMGARFLRATLRCLAVQLDRLNVSLLELKHQVGGMES